jgi:Na+/H+-dicarboxylate symporter
VIHPSATASAAPSRLPGVRTQIFIVLVLGVVLGYVWPSWGVAIRPLADLFLRVVVFVTIVGVSAAVAGAKAQPVLDVLGSTAQVMFTFTADVMTFAPIGVFAGIAATVGGNGPCILFTLGTLLALMYLRYVLLMPIAFTMFRSDAALPKALEIMERLRMATAVVARWKGQFDDGRMRAFIAERL